MFFYGTTESLRAQSVVEDMLIARAQARLDQLSKAIAESSDPMTNATCQAPLQSLRDSFTNFSQSRFVLLWPISLSKDYMALLDSKSPVALLVLAYYCVLLESLHHRWWIKGWPPYMLESIRLMLEEKWQVWLDWAAEHICRTDEDETSSYIVSNLDSRNV